MLKTNILNLYFSARIRLASKKVNMSSKLNYD